MSTDTWVPTPAKPPELSQALLQQMIIAGQDTIPNISILADDAINNCRYVMQQDLAFWKNTTPNFNEAELIALIRFFTAAEAAETAWYAGEKSPVIFLNKLLKQRGHRLDKNLLQWIKANSNNQFLPNGPITL